MDEKTLNQMIKALDKAKEELNRASYMSECGSNPGLRQMNSNKAEWLHWVVYLAQHGLKSLQIIPDHELEYQIYQVKSGLLSRYLNLLMKEKC